MVRHSERHIKSDPPDQRELETLAEAVRAEIAASTNAQHPLSADFGIAVAGTRPRWRRSISELNPYDPTLVHGHRLELATIQHILSELATMPLAERSQITGLQTGRAPTIVAGAVILVTVMRAYGLSEIEASEHDILHGAALEAEDSLNRVV